MPNREMLMREASEYIAAKYAPKPDYSELGWIACCLFTACGIAAAAQFILNHDLIRAWVYGAFLVTLGAAVLEYSKHPMSSYERPELQIDWPITDRGYGSIYHEHEEIALLLIAIISIATWPLIRFA